VTIKTDH